MKKVLSYKDEMETTELGYPDDSECYIARDFTLAWDSAWDKIYKNKGAKVRDFIDTQYIMLVDLANGDEDKFWELVANLWNAELTWDEVRALREGKTAWMESGLDCSHCYY